jgi:arsenite methyltransferase
MNSCCGRSDDIGAELVRGKVREHYSRIAVGRGHDRCCDRPGNGSTRLGYSPDELATLPGGADMGLGSGHPVAEAELRPGEVVLDLGSGGGIDCFLAARQVGPDGRVIGVDMTPAMLDTARRAAAEGRFANVEFREGRLESLPIADASVDVVISNCVVNLSPDKPAVWREVARVLKPGGRVAISDIVASGPLPTALRQNPELVCGCVGGAASVDELRQLLLAAGLTDVRIVPREANAQSIRKWLPDHTEEIHVVAAMIHARNPIIAHGERIPHANDRSI